MKDLVSIIIVNYNTEKLLDDCIQSIHERTNLINYEIIVVDNNSEKDSLTPLIKKYPSVIFHILNENIGFGRANNEGVKIAKGDYLFFLNPDTILINNAVFILHAYIQANAHVGVCGGNLYRADMAPAVSHFDMSFYKREYLILLNKKYQFGFNDTGKPLEVLAVMGADLFISKDLFVQCGCFDPDFFMYYEEIYLCDKVRKAGYKIMSVPEAQIIHLEGGAGENKTEELNKWSYQERWYSKFVYFSKTKGFFKTNFLYQMQLLKLKSACLIYNVKKNPKKMEYWNTKQEVMKKTYNRYKSYLHDRQSKEV